MKEKIKIFLIFFLIQIISSKIVKADIITPPTEYFWSPFTVGIFIVNFLLNFIIFGIGYLIFIDRNVYKINKKIFLIAIFLITIFGFIADSITLLFDNIGLLVIAFITAGILILIFNYLICRYFLKIIKKKSIILGIWMSILTNPFLYIIITY